MRSTHHHTHTHTHHAHHTHTHTHTHTQRHHIKGVPDRILSYVIILYLPQSEDLSYLIVAAERTRFAVHNRLRNISCLSPELKIRFGNLLIRPVASFGCQIWGVNFLDLGKGVDGNEQERTHFNYLRHILGVSKNIAGDILRYEAACPPYHAHWISCHRQGHFTGLRSCKLWR